MSKVLDIIRGTTVDGPGFRTSIYLSGCSHNCQGCHNPQSWDAGNGVDMTIDEIMDVVKEEDFDVTLSGGDPLHDPDWLKSLLLKLKENKRNVWLYTGYTWEEILDNPKLKEVVALSDVVVDGKFDEKLRDTDLKFRGSRNQRIIEVAATLSSGEIVCHASMSN